MIKHFLYGIALSLVAFSFTSCEDTNGDNFRVDTDRGYVQFTDNNQMNFIGGRSTLLEFPVDLHTNTNLAGLDVYYKIDKISESDINSVIVKDPGFVHFEPGQIASTIKIEVKSDIPAEGFMFRLTLSGASRDNIDFLSDVETVYLTKDVCLKPLTIATNYVGEVYRVELDSNGNPSQVLYVSNITTSLVPTQEPNVYTFGNGAWGTEFVPALTGNPAHAMYDYPANILIKEDASVMVQGLDAYTSTENFGSFSDLCIGEITYMLEQELFQQNFLVRVVIRPAN